MHRAVRAHRPVRWVPVSLSLPPSGPVHPWRPERQDRRAFPRHPGRLSLRVVLEAQSQEIPEDPCLPGCRTDLVRRVVLARL